MMSIFWAAASAIAGPEIAIDALDREAVSPPVPCSEVSLTKAMRKDWVRDVVVHPTEGRAGIRERASRARQIARRAHKAAIRTDWSGCATWKNGKLIRRFTSSPRRPKIAGRLEPQAQEGPSFRAPA